MYTLFDSFFTQPTILVVSEERLQQAEREARENQLKVLDNRIEELNKYRISLSAEISAAEPKKVGGDLDALDGAQCDV